MGRGLELPSQCAANRARLACFASFLLTGKFRLNLPPAQFSIPLCQLEDTWPVWACGQALRAVLVLHPSSTYASLLPHIFKTIASDDTTDDESEASGFTFMHPLTPRRLITGIV
jgi:hypothetical protein